MIEIQDRQPGHRDYSSLSEKVYPFPTIDFKFQNTGGGTAALWQFTVSVLKAEIDPTPVFNFSFLSTERSSRTPDREERDRRLGIQDRVVDGHALVIRVRNDGWGAARDCECVLNEPILNRLFDEQHRRSTVALGSGDEEQAIRLEAGEMRPGTFSVLHGEALAARARARGRFEGRWQPELYLERSEPAIPIESLPIAWRCRDEKDLRHEGQDIAEGTRSGTLYISPSGFFLKRQDFVGGGLDSDLTYCVMIDPTQGAHERTYAISRQIPPGDVERFHIMIGAHRSCRLRVRFRFAIDISTHVDSEEFDISIWRPRNFHLAYNFGDGDELKRRYEELWDARQRGALDYPQEWELKRIREANHRGFDFPFFDPDAY